LTFIAESKNLILTQTNFAFKHFCPILDVNSSTDLNPLDIRLEIDPIRNLQTDVSLASLSICLRYISKKGSSRTNIIIASGEWAQKGRAAWWGCKLALSWLGVNKKSNWYLAAGRFFKLNYCGWRARGLLFVRWEGCNDDCLRGRSPGNLQVKLGHTPPNRGFSR